MKRVIFLLAGLGFASTVAASPSVPLKCGANLDRVWVYDNLTTLDVTVHLKCGTPVDVLGLEKNYVRVRTADGNEGYVPADAIPSSEMAALTAAAPAAAPAPTVVTAARLVVPVPAAQPVAATQPAPAVVARTVSAPATAQPIAIRTTAVPAPQPEPNVVAMATPPAPSPATPSIEQDKPVPTNYPAPVQAPAPAPVVTPTTHAVTTPRVAPAPRAVAQPAAPSAPTTVAVRASEPRTPHPAAHENATLIIEQPGPVEQLKALAPAPAPAPVQMAMVVRTADVTPLSKTTIIHHAEYSDEDDTPDTVATPADDLASCNVYFSAYGVTPMQYKWIADDRGKRFPGVCPAPEPSMVDYVVIFTHDENFFTNTLPEPVHTDKNGFSDWSPVTAADDTHIPISLMDKAHHEYAWVFHVHRGTFDPSNFTSRRHPQFTKTESSARASSKSIEDAIQYIADTNSHQ